MKALFKLAFMDGWKNVEGRPAIGERHIIPLLEPAAVMAGDTEGLPDNPSHLKCLVFECRKIDEDKAAIFEFLEVR